MILYAIIPVMAGVLYALGGNVNKWWRWLMGLPIGGIWFLVTHRYETLLCIATYWIATSAFPYGEKSWLNKYFSEGEKWAICGIVFG